MRLTATCILILFISGLYQANGQSVVALSSGVSIDINNKRPFYTIPVSLRWQPFKRSAFFIEAIQNIAANRLSDADAYTVNPQLSEHVVLTEAIKLTSFSTGLGGAIILYTSKKNSQFTLDLSTGICSEHFRINYRNYDNKNYEVLNPDVSRDFSGLYASVAVAYNFHTAKRDMFIRLRMQSPSTAGGQYRYKLSYEKTALLQLTFGYKFFYNKK